MNGVDLAFQREGEGGYPLLLIHGWPETRRIWARNVGPLAEAGFEVIAPDLRGFGDSGLAPDDRYDAAAHARDMEALLRASWATSAAWPAPATSAAWWRRTCRCGSRAWSTGWSCSTRSRRSLEGSPREIPRETRMAADYFIRQSRDADGLAAELDTPEKRRAYVAQMYGPRFWAAPGAFTREDVELMTEPFGDADRFRASIANYEYVGGPRTAPEPARMLEPNPLPALVLYGPEDHVIPRDFPERMELAFPEIVGPFVVAGAGHFLMWERARVLNRAVVAFCRDLLPQLSLQ